MKVPVINNSNYTFYFEYLHPMTFIHCDCFKWSKQTKKEMLVDLEALMRIFRVDIFAVIEPQNKKLLKFSIGMGFNHLKDFVGTDGKLYYLFVRRV